MRQNQKELSSGETHWCHAGRETWETGPPKRLHLEDQGAEPPPPHQPGDAWGSKAAPGLHQGGGGSFFSGAQTFHGDALRSEVRPPKRAEQTLIAACAPHAAGAKRPQGKDSPTS